MQGLITLLGLSLAAAAPSPLGRRDTSCTLSASERVTETINYGITGPAISIKASLTLSCDGDHAASWSSDSMPNSQTISGSDTGLPGDINWSIDYGTPGIKGCTAQFNNGDVVSGTTSEDWDTAFAVTESLFGCSVSFGFY